MICAINFGTAGRVNAPPFLTPPTLSEADMADTPNIIVEWRPVVGIPGYDVSNTGQVRSLRTHYHRNGSLVPMQPRILKPLIRRSVTGRPTGMSLSISIDAKKEDRYVHRMVLEAFIGPCPMGHECCHGDGDPTNNKLTNLRWDTRQSNNKDMDRHGTRIIPTKRLGEEHPCTVLTADEVRSILSIKEWKYGMGVYFARKLGVDGTVISRIRRGKTWGHLK